MNPAIEGQLDRIEEKLDKILTHDSSIEIMKRLRLKEKDVILIRTKHHLSMELIERIKKWLKCDLGRLGFDPDKFGIWILQEDMDLDVVDLEAE